MRSAFSVVNIVAETEHILIELVHILKSDLHVNAFRFSLKIDDIMNCFSGFVHILDETDNALRLVVLNMLRFFFSFILKNNRQLRIQISGLVQTALDIILFEPRLVKNRIIR